MEKGERGAENGKRRYKGTTVRKDWEKGRAGEGEIERL